MLADNPLLDPDSVFDTSNYQIYNSSGTLFPESSPKSTTD